MDGTGRLLFLLPFQLFLSVLYFEIPYRFYIRERESCAALKKSLEE